MLDPVGIKAEETSIQMDTQWEDLLYLLRGPDLSIEKHAWMNRDISEKLQVLEKLADFMKYRTRNLSWEFVRQMLIPAYPKPEVLVSDIEELDWIIGGGFQLGKVYEIYGEDGVGKTTLLHQLTCRTFSSVSRGGLRGATLFIDFEGSFSAHRLRQIAEALRVDPDRLIRVTVKVSLSTVDELLFLCEVQLEAIMKKYGIRLVCIDSATTPFIRQYGSRLADEPAPWESIDWFKKGTRIFNALKRVAERMKAIVVFSSRVTAIHRSRFSFYDRYYIGQHPDIRITLAKLHDTYRFRVERTGLSCDVRIKRGGMVFVN